MTDDASIRPMVAYAQRGFRVFPLHDITGGACSCGREECGSGGKHPRTKNGVKDATTALEQIRQWWARWPDANIGLATGVDPATGKGLYVEESQHELSWYTQATTAQAAASHTSDQIVALTASDESKSAMCEARNNYLARIGGALVNQDVPPREIRVALLALNQERYGQGRHPLGPLAESEIDWTVMASVQEWYENRQRQRGSQA